MPALQYGQGCYVDAPSAAAAMAAAEVGAVYNAGARVWTVTAATPAASAVTVELTDLASSDAPIARTVTPAFAPCSMLDWDDGLLLGWGLAGVWLLAASVLFVLQGRRAS
jgi:hypothetical protein